MPVGRSGRIVVEFDPELKRRLYARLRSEGRDFKAWLLERVYEYLAAAREEREASRESEAAARPGAEPPPELGELESRVLAAVSSDAGAGRHLDELVEATGLGIGEIHEALLELELHGCVVHRLGLYWRAQPS